MEPAMSKLFRIPFLALRRRSKRPPGPDNEPPGVRDQGNRPQDRPFEWIDTSKEETIYIGTFTPEL